MLKKQRYEAFIQHFSENMPVAETELEYKNTFQLLVAVVLSAQCTDKRVNQTTTALFKRYGSVKKMAAADLRELEQLVKSTGFFRAKAKNIKALSQKILTDFNGQVPDELEKLITLPGVGRKTANVVLGHGFNIPGITVDTHFGRLS